MRSFCLLLVVCSMLLVAGCGATYEAARRAGSMATLPEDRVFPVKPKFTVRPEKAVAEAGIDFEAVYYLEHRSLPGVSSEGGRYLRFWPDGRVMQRIVGRRPAAEEADRFDGGWLGYYQVNEGKLVMEFFAPQLPDFRWTYWKVDALLQAEQILMVRGEMSRKAEELNRVYARHPVKGMKRSPDW